ncbi:MAG: hypothetical protein K0S81_341 [Rhodospirillales bacterium]|jgi:hypothetical protein|nr:hypothetical protein [Rhodospirillales bacterium]
MLPFDKLADRWNQLHERIKPYLTPSERQRQLKREDDLRSRKFEHAIGEWRIWLIAGWMGLMGSMTVPSGVTTKPLIVLTALGFIAFGFYKRYFPSEPPPEELPPERPPVPAPSEPIRDDTAADQAAAERRKKRLMMSVW